MASSTSRSRYVHSLNHFSAKSTTNANVIARAPCPGLNTLANHGFINRNGRGISVQQMQTGFLNAFGFDPATTAAGGQNAVNLCSTQTGRTCTTFDLDMLNEPHQIEHGEQSL